MTCREMCGNGAGTGRGITHVERKLILGAKTTALPVAGVLYALFVVEAGTILNILYVPQFGSQVTYIPGKTGWASALSVPWSEC